MTTRDALARVLALALGATLLAGACGNGVEGDGEDRKVTALNLENGERKVFEADDAVPAGWAICADPSCSVFPPEFPCQILGPGACLMNPECRLKLRCEFDLSGQGVGWARPAGGPDATDAGPAPTDPASGTSQLDPSGAYPWPQPAPDMAPPGCELVCAPGGRPVSCGEINDPGLCKQRDDCEWDEVQLPKPVPMGQAEGDNSSGEPQGLCPPDICGQPPALGYCREKRQLSCEELDQGRCELREDCSWSPARCALMDCLGPGCDHTRCGSFCRPRPIDPVCPPVKPFVGDCPNGPAAPTFDENGCIVGFECTPICPEVFIAPPDCPNGAMEKIVDDRGCVVGYRCIQSCPRIALVAPDCPDGKVVPIYDRAGCLVGYECQDPTRCDALVKDYSAALAQAKQCKAVSTTPASGEDRSAQPPAPGSCGVTVSSALGCMACPTYVNVDNREAIAKLREVERAFHELGCMKGMACPAIACLAPQGAICQADASGTGTCTDLGPVR